jgi:hypothetical protein
MLNRIKLPLNEAIANVEKHAGAPEEFVKRVAQKGMQYGRKGMDVIKEHPKASTAIGALAAGTGAALYANKKDTKAGVSPEPGANRVDPKAAGKAVGNLVGAATSISMADASWPKRLFAGIAARHMAKKITKNVATGYNAIRHGAQPVPVKSEGE